MKNSADQIDSRLNELEIKLSFAEDLVERLNEIVARQARQIDVLVHHVAKLADQIASAQPPAPRSLNDDLPPHY